MISLTEFERAYQESIERLLKGSPPQLSEAIRYSTHLPGKRIRPQLAMATAQLVDLPRSAALSCAISLELAHVFTLIHDDLPCMDDDDFRRGKPSNHKVFGEAMALLAGDALLSASFENLLELRNAVPASGLLEALATLGQSIGARGVIGGQAIELALEGSQVSRSQSEELHDRKTGDLFWASVALPCRIAGCDDSVQSRVENFARALGRAFQMTDDLDDDAQKELSPGHTLGLMDSGSARAEIRDILLQALAPLTTLERTTFEPFAKSILDRL